MTIHHLSGNFQPPSVDKGSSLPQSSSRAPSISSNTALKEVVQPAAEKVSNDKLETKVSASNSVSLQAVESIKSEKAKEKTVDNQIEAIQQFNQSINRTLQFKVDEELGVTIVRVVDKDTDELIRQFPPEELINLSRRLKELNEQDPNNANLTGSKGILLQEKV